MVSEVVDGDSIVVTTSSGRLDVRLIGINAPESEECFASRAGERLSNLVLGEEVTLVSSGVDQFGRVLATVLLGDQDVNRELVAGGYAISAGAGTYVPEEDAAYETGTGLWAADACGPPASADVVITDIDPRGESVTIENTGTTTASVAGWTIRDESSRHRFTFPSGTTLGPGQSVTVSSDDTGWRPGEDNVWNNDGDMGLLLDPSGNVVGRLRYDP